MINLKFFKDEEFKEAYASLFSFTDGCIVHMVDMLADADRFGAMMQKVELEKSKSDES